MAKRKTNTAPAAADQTQDVTPVASDSAQLPPAAVDSADTGDDTAGDTAAAAAAPATTETGPEQAAAADVQADPAAPSPGPEGSASPAPAEPEPPAVTVDGDGVVTLNLPAGGFSEEQRASVAAVAAATLDAAADTSQETLEKQAEVKQPQEPRLDRVLRRLAATLHVPLPWDTAMMSTHTAFLHGNAVELMTRLHLAIVAEGIPVNSQGDNLQFLLEELDKSLRGAF